MFRQGVTHGLLFICALSVLPGCASDREAFENAYYSHDVEQLEAFIREYPDAPFVNEAKRHQAAWLMQQAAKNPGISNYEALIKKYPNNSYLHQAARNELSALVFQEVKKANSMEAYIAFSKRFPFSQQRTESDRMIDKFNFERAKKINTVAAYNQYLSGFPTPQFKQEANYQVAALAFNKLKRNESSEAYAEFIKDYKDSPLIVQATERMLALKLPSSIYQSPQGSVVVHWGKLSMLSDTHVSARFGETQKQDFRVSKQIRVCSDKNPRLSLDRVPANSDITLALLPVDNRSQVVAIYLGEVQTHLGNRTNMTAPGTATIKNLPSCFPPQVSAK